MLRTDQVGAEDGPCTHLFVDGAKAFLFKVTCEGVKVKVWCRVGVRIGFRAKLPV